MPSNNYFKSEINFFFVNFYFSDKNKFNTFFKLVNKQKNYKFIREIKD